jgi:hypothetical protein
MSSIQMAATKELALRIANDHLSGGAALHRALDLADVSEGWPRGGYRYSDQPVWGVAIPEVPRGVGGSRYLVISRATGKVLADQRIGE